MVKKRRIKKAQICRNLMAGKKLFFFIGLSLRRFFIDSIPYGVDKKPSANRKTARSSRRKGQAACRCAPVRKQEQQLEMKIDLKDILNK
jgi:hypothetical protein